VIENQTRAECNEIGSDNKIFVIIAKPAIEKPITTPEEKIKAENLFNIFTFQILLQKSALIGK